MLGGQVGLKCTSNVHELDENVSSPRLQIGCWACCGSDLRMIGEMPADYGYCIINEPRSDPV